MLFSVVVPVLGVTPQGLLNSTYLAVALGGSLYLLFKAPQPG